MNPANRSVADIAYELWESRGKPHGSAEQDWFEAERRARESASETEAGLESFPASDPPASHAPDNPPSNADAKWSARSRSQ